MYVLLGVLFFLLARAGARWAAEEERKAQANR